MQPNDLPLPEGQTELETRSVAVRGHLRSPWKDAKPTQADGPCYLGLDPGGCGGIAVIKGNGALRIKVSQLLSERDLWEWLKQWSVASPFAIIEHLTPRPTKIPRKALYPDREAVESVFLRSSALIYGSYCQMKALLTASEIPYEEVSPRKWQKALSIPARKDSESDSSWKGRLQNKAQQLFPKYPITLATADAVLMAEYCRRVREGRL